MHMKLVVEQGFFHEFAFDNKVLKKLIEFRICWKRSEFVHCWIRTSSHLYIKEWNSFTYGAAFFVKVHSSCPPYRQSYCVALWALLNAELVLMRVGRYIMTSPTHHHFAWHPESLCGVSRNQLISTVNGENPGSRPRWSMHTSSTTPKSDNRALLSLDNSGLSWTVSAPDKVTAVPVRRNGNFQTPISVPAVRPKQCHTLSNPAHRQDYTAADKWPLCG